MTFRCNSFNGGHAMHIPAGAPVLPARPSPAPGRAASARRRVRRRVRAAGGGGSDGRRRTAAARTAAVTQFR